MRAKQTKARRLVGLHTFPRSGQGVQERSRPLVVNIAATNCEQETQQAEGHVYVRISAAGAIFSTTIACDIKREQVCYNAGYFKLYILYNLKVFLLTWIVTGSVGE